MTASPTPSVFSEVDSAPCGSSIAAFSEVTHPFYFREWVFSEVETRLSGAWGGRAEDAALQLFGGPPRQRRAVPGRVRPGEQTQTGSATSDGPLPMDAKLVNVYAGQKVTAGMSRARGF